PDLKTCQGKQVLEDRAWRTGMISEYNGIQCFDSAVNTTDKPGGTCVPGKASQELRLVGTRANSMVYSRDYGLCLTALPSKNFVPCNTSDVNQQWQVAPLVVGTNRGSSLKNIGTGQCFSAYYSGTSGDCTTAGDVLTTL
ncbi:hypothetical protein BGZ82_002017, partial [Podila clonocystis]